MELLNGDDYVKLSAEVFNGGTPYWTTASATAAYVTLVREIARYEGSALRELKPLQAVYDAEIIRLDNENATEITKGDDE